MNRVFGLETEYGITVNGAETVDVVLTNGARFDNDHAHPEYSTPECTTLRQIVTQDKAGERILAECARRRNLKLPKGQEVRLYKNNTDFFGHSYGCHDNYLMQRD